MNEISIQIGSSSVYFLLHSQHLLVYSYLLVELSVVSLNSISQFILSPKSCNSAWIFCQSKWDAKGSYATVRPNIVNNSVPPKGASSWCVFIFPMVKLWRARTDVTLWTMPGLSAPLTLNIPETLVCKFCIYRFVEYMKKRFAFRGKWWNLVHHYQH